MPVSSSVSDLAAVLGLRAWENKLQQEDYRLAWFRKPLVQQWLVVGGILLLAAIHWLVPRPEKDFHNAVYHLNFIPIVTAGMLFGWRAAAWATLFSIAAETPLAWRIWRFDTVYLVDQVGETIVFGSAGLIVGWISSRERQQKTELAEATRELEKVYTELKRNLERLRRAERLSAVAEFSASLAHEIRNPLAGISGAAGILKRVQSTSPNMAACLEIIDKESQRLNKLLTQFLEFARPRVPRMQATELPEVIDSVLALARHTPEIAGIDLRRNVEGRLPAVFCDGEQLKQVLLNLVMNAMQATRQGTVDLRAWADGDFAYLSVGDNGPGVPDDELARIFDPFFTTKENGTGLGLAVASKIVEQHGGTLTAENASGRGLTMVVQLPLRRTEAA